MRILTKTHLVLFEHISNVLCINQVKRSLTFLCDFPRDYFKIVELAQI